MKEYACGRIWDVEDECRKCGRVISAKQAEHNDGLCPLCYKKELRDEKIAWDAQEDLMREKEEDFRDTYRDEYEQDHYDKLGGV